MLLCVCLAAGTACAALGPFDPLLEKLAGIDVDAVAARADVDAAMLIAGGAFAVRGDRGLAVEVSTRPGSMQAYLGGTRGDVVYETIATDEEPAAIAARAWVYQLELFAACVRRGRTPVMRQSPLIDTRGHRLLRYRGQTFHHDRWPTLPAPGSLGRAYLEALRGVLRDIATASGDALDEARDRARDTLHAGGRVYVVTGATMLAHHLPEPFEPWTGNASGGDLVLAVGDFEEAGYHGHWHDIDALRRAGRGVVWIVNACGTRPLDVLRHEVLLDLWAPFGDGVVKVEHYDVRLGPVTGVAQLAAVHAIARAAGLRDEENRRDQRHAADPARYYGDDLPRRRLHPAFHPQQTRHAERHRDDDAEQGHDRRP